jgi:hypothetical protein
LAPLPHPTKSKAKVKASQEEAVNVIGYKYKSPSIDTINGD